MKKPSGKLVRVAILVIGVIAISTLVLGRLYIYQMDKDSNQNGGDVSSSMEDPCINEASGLVDRASQAMDPNNMNPDPTIHKVKDEVIKFDNYQNDTYCLQIVTMGYIRSSNYEDAKKYLELTKQQVQSSEVGMLGFERNFLPEEEMEKIIKFLEGQVDEIRQNNTFGNQEILNETTN